jgi:hypothetical protein
MTRDELEAMQNALYDAREELGLPRVYFPDDDEELDLKLHADHEECPFCGGSDLVGDDYDGGHELTMMVHCLTCGETWFEKYRFIGAWQVEEEDDED